MRSVTPVSWTFQPATLLMLHQSVGRSVGPSLSLRSYLVPLARSRALARTRCMTAIGIAPKGLNVKILCLAENGLLASMTERTNERTNERTKATLVARAISVHAGGE